MSTYPGYSKNRFRWMYAQDVYDGTAFDYYDGESVDSASQGAKKYFPQKTQRESTDAYKERLKLLDPAIYFATGVDSIVGVLFGAESKAQRDFENEDGKGLGDHEDPDSIAYQLMNNVDGNGNNYLSMIKKAAIRLTTKHTIFGLVDGATFEMNEDGSRGDAISNPTIKLIDPESVTNKIYNNGRLVACRVKEMRDERSTLDDAGNLTECYVDYTLEGWHRWKSSSNDTKETLGEGTYKYYATTDQNERDLVLPIFEVELGLDRNVGYIWAKKCISIANGESQLDHAHRNVSFQLLRIVGSQEQYDKIIASLSSGANVIRQEPEAKHQHDFFGASSEFFEASSMRLKEKIQNFFHGMFKDYGDTAREKTATEINKDFQTGLEAFLTILADALDSFENKALWRYAQANLPDDVDSWGVPRVSRPADFSPVDIEALADKLADRYITGLNTVPITAEALAEVLAKIMKADAITVPEDTSLLELAKEIINGKAQETDLLNTIGG